MSKEIEKLSYDEAIAEVETILQQLEQEQLPIDAVLEKSRYVVALIAHCRTKMAQINNEVQSILKELREENSSKGNDTTTPVDDLPF